MKYLALVGDIRGSRELADRGAVQARLQECLAELNDRYADVLVSPLTITLGDEFQALFARAEGIWEIVLTIEARMHPTSIRFGFGVGDILTSINRESAIGMDGPAFYHAREAVQDIKKSEDSYRVVGVAQDEELTNSVLELISDNRKKWSENRINILLKLLLHEKVDAIASALGISKTAVYKNISDGSLKPVSKIFALFTRTINLHLGH